MRPPGVEYGVIGGEISEGVGEMFEARSPARVRFAVVRQRA